MTGGRHFTRALIGVCVVCAFGAHRAGASGTGRSPAERPADSLYRAGREALARRDYHGAADLFARLVSRYPAAAVAGNAQFWRAYSLYISGNVTGNLRDFIGATDALDAEEVHYPAASTARQGLDLRARVVAAEATVGYVAARGAIDSAVAALAQPLSCEDAELPLKLVALERLIDRDPEGAMPTIHRVLSTHGPCMEEVRHATVVVVANTPGMNAAAMMDDLARADRALELVPAVPPSLPVGRVGGAPRDSASSVSTVAPALAGPPERPIGPVVASWPGPVKATIEVRELAGGGVLLWDGPPGGGPMQLLDAPLATISTVLAAPPADSLSAGNLVMPVPMAAHVIPYRGDSLLVFLGSRRDNVASLSVLDPQGKVAGTRQFPLLLRIWSKLNSSVRLDPAVDAQGRSVFVAYPVAPYVGDSAWLDRADLATGRADSVLRVRIGSATKQVRAVGADGRTSTHSIRIPIIVDDNWGVLSDGTIMVVRAIGCRVEDVLPDGSVRAFALSACNEHPLSLDERQQLARPLRAVSAGPTPDTLAAGTPGAPTIDDIPVAVPAYDGFGAVADRDGHLWVHDRIPTSSSEGSLYDVIDRNGTVVDRVRLPVGRRLIGFGAGVAYLTAPTAGPGTPLGLERVRIR